MWMNRVAHSRTARRLSVKASDGLRDEGELQGSVNVIAVAQPASVTSRGDSISGTGKLNGQRAAYRFVITTMISKRQN